MIQLENIDKRVHRAIIDLYELEDEEEVTASTLCNHTGLFLWQVHSAMESLKAKRIIKVGNDGVIIEADNNGYNPFGG